MRRFFLALLVLAAGLPARAAHSDPAWPAAAHDAPPRLVSEGEMDQVTAGGIALRLDLASAATGTAPFTRTQGETRIERATMLKIGLIPGAPPQAQARLLGEQAAEIAIGSGRADASGDASARCSASAGALGDIAFIHSLASAATTPNSATCLCSVFAIAPVK